MWRFFFAWVFISIRSQVDLFCKLLIFFFIECFGRYKPELLEEVRPAIWYHHYRSLDEGFPVIYQRIEYFSILSLEDPVSFLESFEVGEIDSSTIFLIFCLHVVIYDAVDS